MASYMCMFKDFLAFLSLVHTSVHHISVSTVLSFMDYLVRTEFSTSKNTNCLTALRSVCIIFGCDINPFKDNRIELFIKGVTMNRPLETGFYLFIDEHLLCRVCGLVTKSHTLWFSKHCIYCVFPSLGFLILKLLSTALGIFAEQIFFFSEKEFSHNSQMVKNLTK